MGNSGTKFIHLHMDIVDGWHDELYHLVDIMEMIDDVKMVCMLFFSFLTDDLFKTELFVSSHFGTIDYGKYGSNGKVEKWIFHPAYDVVPENRRKTRANYSFYWPVTFDGEVLANKYDNGYGNHINIGFNI
jgi:hypothetical protein